jgi:hypothetical protein
MQPWECTAFVFKSDFYDFTERAEFRIFKANRYRSTFLSQVLDTDYFSAIPLKVY